MKKVIIPFLVSFFIGGCGTGMAVSQNNNTTTGAVNMQKDYSKAAAVNFSASVNVSGTGVDTPTDEANEKVAKITSATVSVFGADDKLVNTLTLKKSEPRLKGDILLFESGFTGVPAGTVRLKFDFNDAAGKSLLSTEGKSELKAKTVFTAKGNLEQISIKKDPAGPETLKTEINEIAAATYATGEINAGLREDLKEESLKAMLEENGLKVTAIKKVILKTYNIKFSSPSVAEALILANQTGKFEYVEQNGFVSVLM